METSWTTRERKKRHHSVDGRDGRFKIELDPHPESSRRRDCCSRRLDPEDARKRVAVERTDFEQFHCSKRTLRFKNCLTYVEMRVVNRPQVQRRHRLVLKTRK